MRIPVPIQGQGGAQTNLPLAVHSLDVPAGSVLVGVLQVGVAHVADVWMAIPIQGQGGVPTPLTVRGLDVPAGGVPVGVLQVAVVVADVRIPAPI